MKRFICILSAFLILCTLAACSDKKDGASTGTDALTTIDGMIVHSYDDDGNLVSEVLSTSRFNGTTDPMTEITVTVPASHIYTLDAKYQNDLQLYCTEKGFSSYSQDEQTGAITFKMTATIYHSLLSEKRRVIYDRLSPLIESDTYPYFLGYITNDNYTEVVIKVEGKGYKKADSSLLAEYIADMCIYDYQIFLNDAPRSCTVTVKDADTDEVITTITRDFI